VDLAILLGALLLLDCLRFEMFAALLILVGFGKVKLVVRVASELVRNHLSVGQLEGRLLHGVVSADKLHFV
jgi:hypothetical protein